MTEPTIKTARELLVESVNHLRNSIQEQNNGTLPTDANTTALVHAVMLSGAAVAESIDALTTAVIKASAG